MDLIYTNERGIEQGVLLDHALDLSFGAKENNFELTLAARAPRLPAGALVFMEGTEYGGIVDGVKTGKNGKTLIHFGRTWHGVLNSKVIQPDAGKGYLRVSGDLNIVLTELIARLGLSALFSAPEGEAGIQVTSYKFPRYCKGYDGIRAMLASVGAKLRIRWEDTRVQLSAVPIVDYTADPVDNDMAIPLSVEIHERKVNHLICLGKGELADREVVHLYADQFGRLGRYQHFTGIEEICETYENSNSEDLEGDGLKKFAELRDNDKAEMSIPETLEPAYDIGDIVGATDIYTGISTQAAVTQKIVKIQNGAVSTEYKTGS